MRLKTTAVSLTAAAAMLATPALAAQPPSAERGTATAPGQLCKSQSHKKTMRGKGKSPFAACVVGAKRAQREVADTTTSTTTAPGRLCKDQSRKKSATDKKSPFAACVTGAAKAQREARS